MWRFLMVVGWLTLGAAPAFAQERATIEKLNEVWMAAFNKGDAAAVAALYTEDAYVLPPGFGRRPRTPSRCSMSTPGVQIARSAGLTTRIPRRSGTIKPRTPIPLAACRFFSRATGSPTTEIRSSSATPIPAAPA